MSIVPVSVRAAFSLAALILIGSSLSLPPLVSEGSELVCESVGKADLLSYHFDSKQSREAADMPLTCHPSPIVLPPLSSGREMSCVSCWTWALIVALTYWECFPLFLRELLMLLLPVLV